MCCFIPNNLIFLSHEQYKKRTRKTKNWCLESPATFEDVQNLRPQTVSDAVWNGMEQDYITH